MLNGYAIKIFISLSLLIACVCRPDKDKRLYYEGNEWFFPVTVKEAVNRYKLRFKPPGYYYTQLPSGSTMRLEFLYEEDDFSDEHQQESALYDRKVTTYLFTYPNHKGLIDSLKNVLETTAKRKMTAEVDTQQIIAGGKTVFKQSVAYWKGVSADSIIFAVRQVPSFKAQKDYEGQVQVFLFGEEPRNGIAGRLRAF